MLFQCCQYHKRENIVSYLTEPNQIAYRSRLQRAYSLPAYEEAKAELLVVRADLAHLNKSTIRTLVEGFEETLTLQRLGMVEPFPRSFSTTNSIEYLNMFICQYVGKVKRLQSSEQRHRWLDTALLEVE
ncbi:MAG: hypothetical protein GF372_08760 [Candidatus Marinimicrobia bacterium]|nr:hypothetical protein [Candidatus Neomarinimicrobiota bacterium]